MSHSARNLEVKAPLASVKTAEKFARFLGAKEAGILRQIDTYYRIGRGRLKLREINSKKAELIHYRRPNRRGSRVSNYSIKVVKDPIKTKRALDRVHGRWIIVRKVRRLFLYKNARIHIDSVQGLGHFLEIEVVLTTGIDQARRLMRSLKSVFSVSNERTIEGSYSDLLAERKGR